ncbi:MAG: hypothetical protein ACR2GD_11480 [Pyrinomonadaceae bacterium]
MIKTHEPFAATRAVKVCINGKNVEQAVSLFGAPSVGNEQDSLTEPA